MYIWWWWIGPKNFARKTFKNKFLFFTTCIYVTTCHEKHIVHDFMTFKKTKKKNCMMTWYFQFHFISRYFTKNQYVIHVREAIFFNCKNLNQQIVLHFWTTIFGPYFQIFIWSSYFLLDWYFFPNMHVKELFSWALFHLNFVNSLITTLFAFNFKILEFFILMLKYGVLEVLYMLKMNCLKL
jgi:hypothetical protein